MSMKWVGRLKLKHNLVQHHDPSESEKPSESPTTATLTVSVRPSIHQVEAASL